jgi:hypothetical protein
LGDNQYTKINLYKDCSTTAVTYTVLPQPVGSIVLNTVNFYPIMTSGIYNVELVVKNLAGTVIKESDCKFLDCTSLECGVVKDLDNTDKLIAYYGLKASNECANCSCEDMCRIYAKLTNNECTECCVCTK